MLRLSSCGSRAQLLRGMWDLPRPGLEPMSPALAGRFSTTAPPGKPQIGFLHSCLEADQEAMRVSLCMSLTNANPVFSQEHTVIRVDEARF